MRNPRKLFYPINMKGNENIYTLDFSLRNTAVKLLYRVPVKWAPYSFEKEFSYFNVFFIS